ncbi:MAG: LCP family protein [Ornithinibacter sp.]
MGGSDEQVTPPSDPERPAPSVPTTRREIHGHRRSGDAGSGTDGRGWRRWTVVGLVAALVLVVGGVAVAAWHLNANINKLDVSAGIGTDRPTQAAGTTGAVNILLIGSDTRDGEGNDGYGDNDGQAGDHSDTNLLVHLSADRTWATVVSIPRDSMVSAPPECSATAPLDDWVMRQWNHNYSMGGTGCLIRTLEGNTGVYVDHYAVVDFSGFKEMVDALGGVEVCTTEDISDPNTHLELTAGRHTLDGRVALQYVRARKSIGDGSDLGRINRQQAFLSSVMQEATSTELLLKPTRLYSFLDAATRSLTTDPEFGVGTMRDLASSVKGIGLDNIEFVTVPSETYPPDPNRVQWKASADQIWTALKEDRPINEPEEPTTATPSPTSSPLTVAPEEIAVQVVNASGVSGLAAQAREELTVQGFPGVTTANAAPSDGGTLVEYSAGNEEAARTVAAAFPGTTLQETTGLGSLVRVTLGTASEPVVEVPNRLKTAPLPTPSITTSPAEDEQIETRTADADICG